MGPFVFIGDKDEFRQGLRKDAIEELLKARLVREPTDALLKELPNDDAIYARMNGKFVLVVEHPEKVWPALME